MDSVFDPAKFRRAKAYVVTAPYVNMRASTSQGFRLVGLHAGAPVPEDASDESVFYHLRDSLIAEVEQPAEPEPEKSPDMPPPGGDGPKGENPPSGSDGGDPAEPGQGDPQTGPAGSGPAPAADPAVAAPGPKTGPRSARSKTSTTT